MHLRLYNYLGKFELIFYRQFGFSEKYATVYASAELTERLRLGVDKYLKNLFYGYKWFECYFI